MTEEFEHIEAQSFLAVTSAAGPTLERDYDARATAIGGVTVLSRPGPDMLFWCQAMGFTEPPSAELIDEIVTHYRARGVERARIVLPVPAEPADWPSIVARHGLTVADRSVKLAMRSPFPSFEPRTDLRTARITPDEQEHWVTLMWNTFGFDAEANFDVTRGALKDPRFEAYACYDGDKMVATGMIWLGPGYAHLSSGATLPSHRGRGAQTALLAARVEAGRRAGCSLLVNEAEVTDEGYSVSARNQVRVGFVPQYERRAWLWTA
ncbi:GNAT family N-acetyltransferase [Actinoplanes sp. TRM 88003]|uniref:GNAT family N-acetyltransferase n=1 Tax=Paractinoplanes aksuensis TaxID=2939490 RepID=A0ABT1DX67_9ACTN|nr:GNAT family N-acetyltransferase [Actinoplanes aksuensis]MCO8275472.1 GNAT family N-acetyltransferase [Actinoplanes aksuensis]